MSKQRAPCLILADNAELTAEEKDSIINDCMNYEEPIDHVRVFIDDDRWLSWQPIFARKIKRIRRITGYFSTVERFNDAKKAELRDRVRHG